MFTVGQELFASFGRNRHKNECTMTISKVGRKWLELDDGRYRANIETLDIDGGQDSSPGKCYVSKQDYDDEVALTEAWASLTRHFPLYSKPKHVTVEDIEQAKKLLGLTNQGHL